MMPILLTKMMRSTKKELGIVLVTIVALCALPLVELSSLVDVSALSSNSEVHLYQGPVSTKNTYAFGFCTFWAAKRREDIGKPIPNTWGDAHTWDDRAAAMGYTVDHSPSVSAIMQTDAGDLGHVAFVEKVNLDGTWEISEMNAPHWDVVSSRKFKASDALEYKFIH